MANAKKAKPFACLLCYLAGLDTQILWPQCHQNCLYYLYRTSRVRVVHSNFMQLQVSWQQMNEIIERICQLHSLSLIDYCRNAMSCTSFLFQKWKKVHFLLFCRSSVTFVDFIQMIKIGLFCCCKCYEKANLVIFCK